MNHNTMEMASESSKCIINCRERGRTGEKRVPKRSQRCSPRSDKPPCIYVAKSAAFRLESQILRFFLQWKFPLAWTKLWKNLRMCRLATSQGGDLSAFHLLFNTVDIQHRRAKRCVAKGSRSRAPYTEVAATNGNVLQQPKIRKPSSGKQWRVLLMAQQPEDLSTWRG